MSASHRRRSAQSASLAASEDGMNSFPSILSATSEPRKSSIAENTSAKKERQAAEHEALHGSPTTGKKRKVRFSLPEGFEDDEEAGEDDGAAPTTKHRKIEAAEAGGTKFESASSQVVADWAKAYCENIVKRSTKAPRILDSNDEAELEDEAEGGKGTSLIIGDSEEDGYDDGKEESKDGSLDNDASNSKPVKGHGASREVEMHGVPGSPDGVGSGSMGSHKVHKVIEPGSANESYLEKLHACAESAEEDGDIS